MVQLNKQMNSFYGHISKKQYFILHTRETKKKKKVKYQ